MLADNNQLGRRLAIEGEGDLIEAALGFVVDADGTFSVALEGDAAEIAHLRRGRGGRSRDGDRGVGDDLFSQVVDDVAGDVDCAWRCAGGVEGGGGCAAGDLASGGRVGVAERTILWAVGDRRNRGGIARHDGAGICRAGDGWGFEGVDAEARGATGLLTRAHAFGDVAGDGVVAGGEPCGCDGGGRVGSGDVAAAGGPGGSDGDGNAGKDVRMLNGAAELDGWRRCDLAKAEDHARGETVGVDIADASGDQADTGGAVVNMRVVKVGLNGTDGDAVVEGGKNVVEADAAGDAPAPGAGLEDGTADLGSAAEDVAEGNEAILLIAEDGAGLCGVDAIVGTVGKEAAFSLDADVAVEVTGHAGDCAGVDGLVLDVADIAVDGMEIAVASVEIEARELGRRSGGGLCGLGGCGQA